MSKSETDRARPRISNRALLVMSLALIATLIACNAIRQTPTQVPTSISTVTRTPTITLTHTSTSTLQPTRTPTATPKPTETVIPTRTRMPTWTPSPTQTRRPTATPAQTPLYVWPTPSKVFDKDELVDLLVDAWLAQDADADSLLGSHYDDWARPYDWLSFDMDGDDKEEWAITLFPKREVNRDGMILNYFGEFWIVNGNGLVYRLAFETAILNMSWRQKEMAKTQSDRRRGGDRFAGP